MRKKKKNLIGNFHLHRMNETKNFMFGFTTTLSKEKEEEIISVLKGNDEGKQFEVISELCNFFSMADPDTIVSVRYKEYTPLLLEILAEGYNFELMLLSTRALTNVRKKKIRKFLLFFFR